MNINRETLLKEIKDLHRDSALSFKIVVSYLFHIVSIQNIDSGSDEEKYLKAERQADQLIIAREKIDERKVMLLATKLGMSFTRKEHDLLGNLAAELGILKKGLGQFFTPEGVSTVLSRIAMPSNERIHESIKEKGFFTVEDSTAGSGSTLATFAEHVHSLGYDTRFKLLAHAKEIDWFTYKMLFVTLSMRDISASVTLGDTLEGTTKLKLFTPSYHNCFELKQAYVKLVKLMERLETSGEAA